MNCRRSMKADCSPPRHRGVPSGSGRGRAADNARHAGGIDRPPACWSRPTDASAVSSSRVPDRTVSGKAGLRRVRTAPLDNVMSVIETYGRVRSFANLDFRLPSGKGPLVIGASGGVSAAAAQTDRFALEALAPTTRSHPRSRSGNSALAIGDLARANFKHPANRLLKVQALALAEVILVL